MRPPFHICAVRPGRRLGELAVHLLRGASLLALAVLASGCLQDGLAAGRDLAELDRPYFDCKVQPVLTKYCATFACHGDGRRFFRVYARNRLRRGGTEAERNAFMRPLERDANYLASVAMVNREDPLMSLLLLKPLDQDGGGYYHGGETEYGMGDVFADRQDADFGVLEAWVMGATEDPNCIEPGSDQ